MNLLQGVAQYFPDLHYIRQETRQYTLYSMILRQ